jgi:HAE1 family hydrophobic/amphiphilic exporter-1
MKYFPKAPVANSGSCLINLKSWKDRKHTAKEIIDDLQKKCAAITDADIEFFQPPSIPGYGAASGFELRLLDKTGNNDYHQMEKVSQDFVKALNKRPEIGSAFTFYSASYPQYMLRLNNDIAEEKGVSIGSAMDNLSTMIGSDYETGFIRFGKPYKVIVQASPQYRAFPEDLMRLTTKNDKGEMVPYSDFMHLDKVYGMSEITRHNLYNSAEVSGSPAPGYSSGQAIKAIEEVSDRTFPTVSITTGQAFPRMKWTKAIRQSSSSSYVSSSSISSSPRSTRTSCSLCPSSPIFLPASVVLSSSSNSWGWKTISMRRSRWSC